MGGGFQEENFASGKGVILSHRFWKSHFGGDATVLGRMLKIDNAAHIVQGVLAENAEIPLFAEVDNFHLFQDDEAARPICFETSARIAPDALFVRSTLSSKDLEATIASVMRDTVPAVRTGSVAVLSELRGERSLPHRQIIGLLAAFGGTAILLAALGLSALLSDSVSRGRQELGIRATLGATPNVLIRHVLLQGLWRTGLGVVLGLGAALASGRYLQSLLFGIRAGDPATLAGVASLLLFLGLVSSLIPALRAASVDPARALREE